MHKSNLYLFAILLLIAIFLFGAHYLRYQQHVIYEKDGYQLIEIDKSQTILPHKEPIVFVIETPTNGKEIYKFGGYENEDFGTISYYHYRPDTVYADNNHYFIEGFKNNLPYQRKLEDLSFEARYDIVHSGTSFEARQLIQHNLEPGILGYIDTMPLIFIFLGCVVFVILKAIDIVVTGLLKIFKNPRLKIIIQSLLIVVLILFLTMVRLTPWHPSSHTALLIRNAFVIVPIFILMQMAKRRFSGKEEFWKNQLIFFVIIFLGGNLLLRMANKIGYLIDVNTYSKITIKPFFCTYDSLAIGFLLAFAVGYLMNNFTRVFAKDSTR